MTTNPHGSRLFKKRICHISRVRSHSPHQSRLLKRRDSIQYLLLKKRESKMNFFFQITFKECCLAKNFKKCIIFVKVSHMRTLFSRKYRFFPKPKEIYGMNLYSYFQLDYSTPLIWDFQILLINQSRTDFCIKRFRLKDFYKILVYIFCSCLR